MKKAPADGRGFCRFGASRCERLRRLHEAAQHVVQDAAVSVVLDFVGGIDAAKHRDLLRLAVRAVDGQGQLHARLEAARHAGDIRSEEHTSELQSLMRISYAVFCLKKKKKQKTKQTKKSYAPM